MDHLRNGLQADPRHHGQGDLVDHLPRVPCDDGRSQDGVGALVDVDLDETLLLTVEDETVTKRGLTKNFRKSNCFEH